MGIVIVQVDAFAREPFEGNPAGVCLLAEEREAAWMQSVAAEMNLSETAFVRRRADGSFSLRWFTPRCEVDLCGHATLAAAHVLWEIELLQRWETAVFHTRGGTLTAVRRGEWTQLDFPAIPFEQVEPQRNLERALGVAASRMITIRRPSRTGIKKTTDSRRSIYRLTSRLAATHSASTCTVRLICSSVCAAVMKNRTRAALSGTAG